MTNPNSMPMQRPDIENAMYSLAGRLSPKYAGLIVVPENGDQGGDFFRPCNSYHLLGYHLLQREPLSKPIKKRSGLLRLRKKVIETHKPTRFLAYADIGNQKLYIRTDEPDLRRACEQVGQREGLQVEPNF